jgi:hypothetical protein
LSSVTGGGFLTVVLSEGAIPAPRSERVVTGQPSDNQPGIPNGCFGMDPQRINVIARPDRNLWMAVLYGQVAVSNGVCWDDITIDAGFSYQRELKQHWAIVGSFAEPNLDEPAALLTCGLGRPVLWRSSEICQ